MRPPQLEGGQAGTRWESGWGGRRGLSAELGGNEKPQPLPRGPRASHPPTPCTQLHPSAPPTSGRCTLSSAYRRATEAQIGGATGAGLHSKFTAELSDLCPWPQLCTALGPEPLSPGPTASLAPAPPGIAGDLEALAWPHQVAPASWQTQITFPGQRLFPHTAEVMADGRASLKRRVLLVGKRTEQEKPQGHKSRSQELERPHMSLEGQ